MINNKKTIEWLIKNRTDINGNVNLSNLNFGNKIIILSGIQAYTISNSYQRARECIYNDNQFSKEINNYWQKANEIDNDLQSANILLNDNQAIIPVHKHKWVSKCSCGDEE